MIRTFRSAGLVAAVLTFGVPTGSHAQAAAPDDDDTGMPTPSMNGPAPNVRKITDGSLTCEQLFAESQSLEQAMASRKAESQKAMDHANQARDALMASATGSGGAGMAGSMASSALSMIPIAGMFSGMAAKAAAQARMEGTRSASNDMSRAYQDVAKINQDLEYAAARNDYVIQLFMARKCKVPAAAQEAKPPASQ